MGLKLRKPTEEVITDKNPKSEDIHPTFQDKLEDIRVQ